MDILTPKGQETLEIERRVVDFLCDYWDCDSVETPKNKPAKYDGMFIRDGEIVAIYETRVRNMASNDYPTILCTYKKLLALKKMSELTCVPSLMIYYLKKCGSIIVFRMTDEKGNWEFLFQNDRTWTQDNINGGVRERLNSYLPIAKNYDFITSERIKRNDLLPSPVRAS